MAYKNLEEAIQASGGNIVKMMRNSQIGAYVYPVVAPEFTNWRDEQRAWARPACCSIRPTTWSNLFVEGPDALKLLSHLATNSFKNFTVDKAKQFAPCNYNGQVIGDGILFYLERTRWSSSAAIRPRTGSSTTPQAGKYNVKVEYDDRSPSRPMGKPVFRKFYRYQIQGPNAQDVIKKLNGGTCPDIKFFNMGHITIAGRKVRALRHGMAGAPGLEVWGPYAEAEEIRAAILEAGKDAGIVQVGARAYATNTLESGWIPSPVPAVYTGDKMKPYREWLPGTSYEANASLGGSFVSNNIEDYYTTPYELGYDGFTKFDHDFIGKEALQAMQGKVAPQEGDVRLERRRRERRSVRRCSRRPGENYKFIDLPLSNYASSSFDSIMSGGKVVGASMFSGYSFNERKMLSLGFVEEQYAKPGTPAHAGVGRGKRRHQEDHRRAPQADRDAGRGRPDARTRRRRAKPIIRAGAQP